MGSTDREYSRDVAARIGTRWWCRCWILLAVSVAASSCQSPSPQYQVSATVKDIMFSIVDPSADGIWGSVGIVVTPAGTEDLAPKTEEQWLAVRRATINLMEASNSLQIPGRLVAHPHEKSNAPGVELEPEQIKALIDNDPATWTRFARALHDASLPVLAAVDSTDKEALFTSASDLDTACENCHKHYWYPNEKRPNEPPSQ